MKAPIKRDLTMKSSKSPLFGEKSSRKIDTKVKKDEISSRKKVSKKSRL